VSQTAQSDAGSADGGDSSEVGDLTDAQLEADVAVPPSCDDGSCDPTCEADAGLTRCDDRCTDLMSDPTHCGDCAKDCGAGMLCDMGNCKKDCGDLTLCDHTCLDLRTDVDHCGACDKKCPLPTGAGTPVCHAKTCGVVCNDGEPACGTTCCASPPPNKSMVCQDGKTCVARCLGVSAVCGDGQTTCASWDFESGTTEGITVPAVATPWDGITLASTTARQAQGKRSLAIGVDNTNFSTLDITIHLCDDMTKPFDASSSLGFHSFIRVEAAPGSSTYTPGDLAANYSFYSSPNSYNDTNYHHPDPDTWVSVDDPFVGNVYPVVLTDVVIHVYLYMPVPWKGTVYLDDIRIY
jgi:hypothetical protein